jgi:hypothetical protein
MLDVDKHFKDVIARDFFVAMCGEKLGEGIGRAAYVSRIDPNIVIKIESGSGSFQNVFEWETWHEARGTEFEKWFAPCVSISSSGIILLQRRTQPVTGRLPQKMPAFLGDFKRSNYGKYKGKIVAHDYGRSPIMRKGLTRRMTPVTWFDDTTS